MTDVERIKLAASILDIPLADLRIVFVNAAQRILEHGYGFEAQAARYASLAAATFEATQEKAS